MSEAHALEFGDLLKDWRAHRRVSQLALSAESGISQRHISFLETGRSRPSRAMVLALADSLDVPLRERNALLQSAGFTAVYSERPLDDARTARADRNRRQAKPTYHPAHRPNERPCRGRLRYWPSIMERSSSS